ncbi:hypothetical protein K469DRAFT_715117 [Zopfia rhizophila CBS 207.26]|uniref:Secreted protein n=1 Tax=Zopfia rhizophila CBS 207.26 TaxID=1314779 RepID=A0A6A6EQU7_9PEZI|nr:hypothetical protein K469DRAFT_715117 [Zopfia rhizophila CBS 207.26]
MPSRTGYTALRAIFLAILVPRVRICQLLTAYPIANRRSKQSEPLEMHGRLSRPFPGVQFDNTNLSTYRISSSLITASGCNLGNKQLHREFKRWAESLMP